MRNSRKSLRYGLTGCKTGATEGLHFSGNLSRPRKYLAFQVDLGGWNNILMQFEILVVMAWITGRTLILPPARRFYLLGDEPRLLEDFLDLDTLRRHLPVLTAEEFATASKSHRDIATDEAYHDFMSRHSFMPPWNGLENILLFPSDALQMRPDLKARLAGPSQVHRQLITISREAEQSEFWYFPMVREYRMFGVAECFFMFGSEKLERKARALLRDAIRYRKDIIVLAERAINSAALGGTRYSAIHVRRGDFQYEKTRIDASKILANLQPLLSPEQPVYLATDESDAAFLDVFREKYETITFHDLPLEIVADTPLHWCGIVETLICAAAPCTFIGTRLSTFSARIALLRGHMSCTKGGAFEGTDTTLYYTQPPLHKTPKRGLFSKFLRMGSPGVDAADETRIPWWLSKDPVWARTYEVCWAETDV